MGTFDFENEKKMKSDTFVDIDEEVKFIKKYRRFIPKFIIYMILDTDAYYLQTKGLLHPADLEIEPLSFYLKPKGKKKSVFHMGD